MPVKAPELTIEDVIDLIYNETEQGGNTKERIADAFSLLNDKIKNLGNQVLERKCIWKLRQNKKGLDIVGIIANEMGVSIQTSEIGIFTINVPDYDRFSTSVYFPDLRSNTNVDIVYNSSEVLVKTYENKVLSNNVLIDNTIVVVASKVLGIPRNKGFQENSVKS